MVFDPIITLNLVLCIIILAFGIWGYIKRKEDAPLYIGIAFGLFGVSHLMTLLGLVASVQVGLIIIRALAYLLVIFALYRMLFKKQAK